MQYNSSINRTCGFAHQTGDHAEGEDSDADIPLTVEKTKKNGNGQDGGEQRMFFAKFAVDKPAVNNLFENWPKNYQGNSCKDFVKW